jgi:hypothetical protein
VRVRPGAATSSLVIFQERTKRDIAAFLRQPVGGDEPLGVAAGPQRLLNAAPMPTDGL